MARDKADMFIRLHAPEFWHKHQKKFLIGSIALTGALMAFGAAEAYITHDFGLASLHDALNHGHEAAKQASNHDASQHLVDVQPEHHPAVTDTAHMPPISRITPKHLHGLASKISGSVAGQEIADKTQHLKLEVHIGLGDGPTQAIKKLFPGHSPREYLAVFKEAVKLHGPNIFRGIPHYSKGQGMFGFSHEGTARLTKAAYQTIESAFKIHR